MQIEKPKLFLETRDFIIFVAIFVFIIALRLAWSYQSYSSFISKPFYYLDVTVLNAYQKSRDGKEYTVLKLSSDSGLTFFTSSYRKDNLKNKRLRVQIYPSDNISFVDYLGYFYVKSRIKDVQELETTTKDILLSKVSSQHQNSSISSFYNAIFFATALQKELRDKVSALGVSHLVALSGFHLGILWGLIYGVLLLGYRPLQKRYFPYRYALFDIGIVAILLLGSYVWFVDFPPSLVRSFAMVLVGWVVILLGIELLSFTFLTTIALVLISLFPSLLVSLGFQLSIMGVFYIFLLLQYSIDVNKWLISILFIPFGIFILMLPVVHGIFGLTTPYQLLSPVLSLLFVPFYPLAMLLHISGMGDVLDSVLLWVFNLPNSSTENILPLWAVAIYVSLS
ncbi:MAG TPA: ComEC/Rec2 family competence protein, partial [Sulfurovum sp.]|nr:ComEC/Rec2 family competence protein [Sulfurovum sp.]